jgi:hypothetical protein
MCLPRKLIEWILQVAHDSSWWSFRVGKDDVQTRQSFIDPDGTITEALQTYVREHNLDLPLTGMSMKGVGE